MMTSPPWLGRFGWRAVNRVGAVASIVALAVAITTGLSDAARTLLLVFALVLIIGALLSNAAAQRQPLRILTQEQERRMGINTIEKARDRVVLFGGDLSWAPQYVEAIRAKVQAGVDVLIVRQTTTRRGDENQRLIETAGARVVLLLPDHDVRATVTDPQDRASTLVFYARKVPEANPPLYRANVFGPNSNPLVVDLAAAICHMAESSPPRRGGGA